MKEEKFERVKNPRKTSEQAIWLIDGEEIVSDL